MLRPASEKPVMVMLHGAGSSASIFRIQTHFIAKELSKSFDLVFLDAPTPCAPGPGVLPLFADMPGYYRWLTTIEHQTPVSMRLIELFNVSRHIQKQLDSQKIKPAKVEAILGFSQGALVAMAMLGLRQVGLSAWDNLRFCVSIGAGATGSEAQLTGIENMVAMLSRLVGRDDGKFPGFIVNAMGTKDLWYGDGKRLANSCAEGRTVTMNYRDGHVVPRQKDDVWRLLKAIQSIDQRSKSGFCSAENSSSAALNLPLSVLTEEDNAQALAVLVQNGMHA